MLKTYVSDVYNRTQSHKDSKCYAGNEGTKLAKARTFVSFSVVCSFVLLCLCVWLIPNKLLIAYPRSKQKKPQELLA